MKGFKFTCSKNNDGTHSVTITGKNNAIWQTFCYENEPKETLDLIDNLKNFGYSTLQDLAIHSNQSLKDVVSKKIQQIIAQEKIDILYKQSELNSRTINSFKYFKLQNGEIGAISSAHTLYLNNEVADGIYGGASESAIKWINNNEIYFDSAIFSEEIALFKIPMYSVVGSDLRHTLYRSTNGILFTRQKAEDLLKIIPEFNFDNVVFIEDCLDLKREMDLKIPDSISEIEARKTSGLPIAGKLAHYECDGQMSFDDIDWDLSQKEDVEILEEDDLEDDFEDLPLD